MKRKIFISEAISILYMCLYLYTASNKLLNLNLSREQMAMMPLLNPVVDIVVWLIPTLEIVIAIIIFIPRIRKIGLIIATTLMIAFTSYIIYMMTNYSHLPCSCGGFLEELSWSGHLIFNCIFILLGVMATRFHKRIYSKVEMNKSINVTA